MWPNREGVYADSYCFDPHVWYYIVWCLFGAYLLIDAAYIQSYTAGHVYKAAVDP